MKYKVTVIALVVILIVGVILFFSFRGANGEDTTDPTEPAVETTAELFRPTEETTGETEVTTEEKPTEEATTTNEETTAATTTTTARTTTTATAGFVYPFDFPGISPAMARIPAGDEFYLILVNRNYALPDNFTRNHVPLTAAVPGYPAQLHTTAARYYHQMYQAARQAGVVLTPLGGYRTTEHQNRNFTNRIARYRNEGHSHEQAVNMAALWIKPPRCSEHETGLAMDIGSINMNFEDSAAFAWLTENAHNYGFILRYPRNATEITMVNFEPWHWRFVGVENARAIRASGLVLETWLQQNR